jgi:hypothetical protein
VKHIYDAVFEDNSGSQHWYLGTFWWVDENGQTGIWSRQEAYDYARTHAVGEVCVVEGGCRVNVRAYYNDKGVQWIQTEADGTVKDNLTTLAERHRRGLLNN